jgi:hypothetical protein
MSTDWTAQLDFVTDLRGVMQWNSRCKYLKILERVKGIEPSSSAWKAVALPLSYTRAGKCLREISKRSPPSLKLRRATFAMKAG